MSGYEKGKSLRRERPSMEGVLFKTCLDCGLNHDLDGFYNEKLRYCKPCMKIRSKGQYARKTHRALHAYPNKRNGRHLYVVSREGLPGFKIGSSKNVDNRMRSLRKQYKCNVAQHAVFRDLGCLESDVHFLLRDYKLPGKERELFDISLDRILAAIGQLIVSG